MIERIYIPTVRRWDNQITYNALPENLKDRVVMVVEEKERTLYDYPCEYLIVPSEYVGTPNQLSRTRKFIHQHAGEIKYLMIDDDIIFKKRNRKYFGFESDMEKSKRDATHEEINALFDRVDVILDSEEFGVVGISSPNFCNGELEVDCTCVTGIVFCDGRKISKVIDKLDTSTRVSEDVMFMFFVLSSNINTKVIQEFTFSNRSELKEMRGKRPAWEKHFEENSMPEDFFQTQMHYDDLRYIQSLFPGSITISQDEHGKWKNVKHWRKVFESSKSSDIRNFF